ncbi:MAG: GDP-mannose 4,6-dehydratase [Bdellovibrionales bacterium]|nr:GDP-mannose 4,6-dehydratase [Bdellovibrionales bacterium]
MSGTEFFLPSVYRQIAKAEGPVAVLKLGNIDLSRDLSAVQDFSNAITAALKWSGVKGSQLGYQVFNLSSGSPKSLRSMIEALSKAMGKKVDMVTDTKLVREGEASIVFGDNSKFSQATGWYSSSQSEEQLIQGFLEDLD